MADAAPRLSIIIPVKADPRLEDCLAAIDAQVIAGDAYETIVVDNEPDDATRAIAQRHGARYLVYQSGGSYAARQHGVRAARGPILVFTDSDCRPPPGWLATLARRFDDPACQVVIGPSVSAGRSTVALWAQAIDDSRWNALLHLDRIAFCDTRNVAMRRDVLDVVAFDPEFRQAGDVDFGLRLYRAGIEIRMEPEAWVEHDNPRSLRVMLSRGVRRGRGLHRLALKHGAAFGPIGQRPLRLAGVDLKTPILALGRHSVLRWPVVGVVGLALVPLFAILSVLARVPGGRRIGQRPFVIFERLTLLFGRLLR